jgi:hypothetical protein
MLRRRLDKKKIEDKSDVQLTKTHFKKVEKKKIINPCTPIKLVTCHLTSNKLGKTLKLNF